MTVKEKAEENYTKVYLNGDISLDTEEKYFAYTKGYCKGHKDGFAEGEIIGKEKQWIATGKAQKKTSAKIKELEKENKIKEEIIIGEQKEIDYYKSRESHWDEIEEDAKRIAEENSELKTENNDLRAFAETLSENHANEWQEQQQVILKLNEQIEKMKNKLNCSKYHYCFCKDKNCKNCKDWKMDD